MDISRCARQQVHSSEVESQGWKDISRKIGSPSADGRRVVILGALLMQAASETDEFCLHGSVSTYGRFYALHIPRPIFDITLPNE